ncbi:ShlB/FhaC/HecB family hemolysin secretion/activation protein [Hydrogenophaga sp.]|uniref:ShlB/FhaC/HecB family hemolysin secretion/activation protein n=1 Tax=Hydrogenophaga sp. TaxID=1904254 RepID=UPI00271FEF29|nr:POTRA domain-containing protein [Hydrogenophaga sp.]MDO9438756.1 ShlB/FhaC/HecB family hemolysin secretion/activation protein [Hydrogenophaga sp.]
MPRHVTRQLLLAGASWWLATGVGAQSVAPVGSPLDTLPRPQLPEHPGSPVQVEVQRPQPPAPAVLNTQITPLKFDIEGVRSIPFDEVSALFAPLAGKPTSVATLVERSQQATALYQRRGYALSFFFVPMQDFANGVVRIVAVEGHVQTVRIEGNAGKAERKLREIAEHILREKPLTSATFEHFTTLLGRVPGIGIQAQVALPSNTDGATTLVLQATHKPYDITAGLETRKPNPRAVVTGVLNNPLVPGSQLGASTLLSSAKNDHYNAVHYEQFVGSEGLSLKGSLSQYRGDPDEQLGIRNPLQRETEVDRAELTATLPLKLSREASWITSAGIYGTNTSDTIRNPANGAQLVDETHVRALFGQLTYASQRPNDAVQLNLRLTHGMSGLGAQAGITSNVPGLTGPSAVKLAFAKLQFEANHQHRFANRFGTAVSFGVQHSPHNLPSSEKVSYGGNRFARGYGAGEAVGDSGWGLGLELNRAFAVDSVWLRQWQPYVLLEAARVYTRLGTPVPAQLRSVSVGLRLTNHKQYSLDLAVSKPTGDMPIENTQRHWRANVTLSYRLGD